MLKIPHKRIVNELHKKQIFHYKLAKEYVSFYYNNLHIKFIFPLHYPFSCPKEIFIDGRLYDHNLLYFYSKKMEIFMKTHFKTDCMICSSYLCPNNWLPTLGIIETIDQYIERRKFIKKLHSLLKLEMPDDAILSILEFLPNPFRIKL